MFSKVMVENFTSFDHFEFNLIENKTDKKAKKMAVIYGENGIGKTCLIKCFKFLKHSYMSLLNTEELSVFFGATKGGVKRFGDDSSAFFVSAFDEYRISGYIKDYFKINAKGDMKTSYEIILNKKKYMYSMTFNKKSIASEKLLCNGDIVFSCSTNRIDFSERDFLNEELKEKLISSFGMYFGEKHTLLSCLNYTRRNVSLSFFKAGISKELLSFMNFLDALMVVTKEDEEAGYFRVVHNRSSFFLPSISSGNYSERLKERLKRTESALSMFFSSLYSSIKSVEYDIVVADSGAQKYHLFFIEKKDDEIIRIPYELESTGTKKMANLFASLYEIAKTKNTIVIDEIDNGINDILLRSIFESLEESLSGQFIVTTHNTLLLKYAIKKNIYLLDRDENDHVVSYSLDEFGRKIQAGTDIIGQYLKGLYGGVPQSGAFSMKYIVEALDNNE